MLLIVALAAGRGVAQSEPVPGTPPTTAPTAASTPPPNTTPPPTGPAAQAEAEEPPPGPPEPPAPAPAPPLPRLRRYGDAGTSEIALGIGYSSIAGFLAAGGFRYFVVDGVAPGVEATYVRGGTNVLSYGLALGSLRVVAFRSSSVAFVLTGRAGRVFLSDHADGWGAGVGGGIVIALGGGAGLEIGYQALWLLPSSFCVDLSTCVLQGPVFGVRFAF